MSSVPDFSQASAAAAVERVTPGEGEPLTAADAAAGTAGLAAGPDGTSDPEAGDEEPGDPSGAS